MLSIPEGGQMENPVCDFYSFLYYKAATSCCTYSDVTGRTISVVFDVCNKTDYTGLSM